MKLSELKTGESGRIIKVLGSGNFRKRIIEMGFVRGKEVKVLLNAPLKDPIKYQVMDYEVSLRRNEAALIEIISEQEAKEQRAEHTDLPSVVEDDEVLTHIAQEKGKTINVALVGNPNCGKTSLFNLASGAHEHVGNYSGITVDAKEGHFNFDGYRIQMADLPGTYSLSTYSPEELYVRKHIFERKPDLILNIVAASNLERNLYLTTQLLDMDIPMVIALNMYDELEKNGDRFDYKALGDMIGVPIVPTVASEGFGGNSGINELFQTVIRVYEGTEQSIRHVHINHGGDLQRAIDHLTQDIKAADNFESSISARFFATKLMEKDRHAEAFVATLSNSRDIMEYRDKWLPHIEDELSEDSESAVINAKYGFISGALAETYSQGDNDVFKLTRTIDQIITHKFWGYPIFLLFMWIMFACTFSLGAYPQDWIDAGVNALMELLRNHLPAGPLSDMLIDGCVGGVGAVLSFLPNILILYFFVALMEDSGYLSRAAFLMDKIMHRMGLHGKSFVPMLMGFGCGIPAIMATRTLESRNNRMITMLITPFMSCSARIPVYVLFTAAFFPKHASVVMMGLYCIGILVAIGVARLFKKTLFKGEDTPFVMELPPYRMPTLRAVGHHMWEKSVQYLKKMGTTILAASVIIWALGYFPLQGENETLEQHQGNSYIGRIGKAIEPAVAPIGFDWKMGVSVLSALPAKEIAISTLSILYLGEETNEEDDGLVSAIQADPNFSPLKGLVYMLFILLCFPCISAIIAVKAESGSWKWAAFVTVYTTGIAWLLCFVVYQIGSLLV
ncbi:MAG: ferrous iron transport protein B [Paludibacteraceae bacterium]|nr:ferrous iron transport protein B [Paludibacteraceae bacterium]